MCTGKTLASAVALFLASSLSSSAVLAQKIIAGQVVLIDGRKPNVGVQDARVVVLGANKETIGSGLTNSEGRYAVDVPDLARAKVLEVRKMLHVRYPHRQLISDPANAQPTVRLSLASADTNYRKSVALYLADKKAIEFSPYGRAASFASVAALPNNERAEVLMFLKESRKESEVDELARAIARSDMTTAFERSLLDVGFNKIGVIPDLKDPGRAVLVGSVDRQEDARKLKNVLDQYSGREVRLENQVATPR